MYKQLEVSLEALDTSQKRTVKHLYLVARCTSIGFAESLITTIEKYIKILQVPQMIYINLC